MPINPSDAQAAPLAGSAQRLLAPGAGVGTRPFLESVGERALLLVAEQEGDVQQRQAGLAQVVARQRMARLVEHLLEAGAGIEQPALQGARRQRQLRRDAWQ